jgi:hypothetical protein
MIILFQENAVLILNDIIYNKIQSLYKTIENKFTAYFAVSSHS